LYSTKYVTYGYLPDIAYIKPPDAAAALSNTLEDGNIDFKTKYQSTHDYRKEGC
jgi:hypothetical protein